MLCVSFFQFSFTKFGFFFFCYVMNQEWVICCIKIVICFPSDILHLFFVVYTFVCIGFSRFNGIGCKDFFVHLSVLGVFVVMNSTIYFSYWEIHGMNNTFSKAYCCYGINKENNMIIENYAFFFIQTLNNFLTYLAYALISWKLLERKVHIKFII